MSKVLIIPDVHGRPFWRKAKEKINDVDKVVFLGDYLDPYSYEGITRENAIEEFKEIIQFKVDNPDKVILLLGNHDCAYCYDFGSASRYDYTNTELIKEMFENSKSLFQLKYFSEGILYTHAGVTNDWLKSMDFTITYLITKPEDFLVGFLWEVSRMRGGWSNTGSMIWSDVREGDREFTYYQVFGHTQLESEPIITERFACLDVRRPFILDTETKKIEEYA